jgi:hypothetical protein
MKGNRVWVIVLLFLLWPMYVKWTTGAWPIPQRTIDFSGGVRLIWQMDPADSIAKGLTADALQRQALQIAKDIFLFRLREFDSSDLTTSGSDIEFRPGSKFTLTVTDPPQPKKKKL